MLARHADLGDDEGGLKDFLGRLLGEEAYLAGISICLLQQFLCRFQIGAGIVEPAAGFEIGRASCRERVYVLV